MEPVGRYQRLRNRQLIAISIVVSIVLFAPVLLLGVPLGRDFKDGSLIMTLQVMDTIELFRWILGWGQDVEVLEPPEIREAVMETAEAVRKLYRTKRISTGD